MQSLQFLAVGNNTLAHSGRLRPRTLRVTLAHPTIILSGCLAVWILMRACFFVGLFGSDDLYLLRYSVLWDRVPANGWEARLLGNGLTWLAIRLFGFSELTAVIPSLAASLVILVTTIWFCERHLGANAAWWSGLLVALLPLDVEMATTVSPHTVMTAWMVAGTALFLGRPDSRLGRNLSAACLGLGVVTHLAGMYYLASLVAAALFVDRKRYARSALAALTACGLCIALDMAVLQLAFGDALLRLRLGSGAVANTLPIPPATADGSLNGAFFLWPVSNLVFSKALGVTPLLALLGGLLTWHRLTAPMRVLFLATMLLWLWMSYGSAVPWDYRPFARNLRYLQPATLALAALFGSQVVHQRRRRVATALGSAALSLCVLNLLGSGSWDQRTHISRELLEFLRQNQQGQYLTDYHTLNEMFVLNGLEPLPNVATTKDVKPSKLLDRNARRLDASGFPDLAAFLVNPLNADRTPEFREVLNSRAGRTLYEAEPDYRTICRIIPPLRRFPWSVKKPAARVVALDAP